MKKETTTNKRISFKLCLRNERQKCYSWTNISSRMWHNVAYFHLLKKVKKIDRYD